MNSTKLLTLTGAVALALGTLAGCDRRDDATDVARDTTTPTPSTTTPATPPAGTPGATATAPATPGVTPGGATTATPPGTGGAAGDTGRTADAAGTGASGSSGSAGGAMSNAAQAVDDATITASVKSKLLADDQVKGTSINVDTSNGTVRLTGSVSSQAEIDRALQIARGVDGVKNVENNLKAGAS